MKKNDLTFRVAGRAGDGSLTTGDVLSKIWKDIGLWLATYKDFPSNIRGLPTNMTIRLKDRQIYYGRKNRLDYLLAFDDTNVRIHLHDLVPGGVVIYDNSVKKELPPELIRDDIYYYYAPLKKIAKEELGLEVIKNIVAVGVASYLLGMDQKRTSEIIYKFFHARKGEKIASSNVEAFLKGWNYAKENLPKKDEYVVEEIPDAKKTYFIMGNEAVAFGAIVAGCRFISSYPITPATDVLEILARELPKYGGVMIQAEDELSAINYAAGAAYAGVRAMTSTSGPGLSLKTETLGLLVMNETPLVIYVAQRGGPSTGLPTKPEQSDLFHAVFGGHGDAPRIVIAPGNVKEMYWLTIDAFNLAEKYQTPVILLTDQILAQNKFSIPAEDITIDGVKIERGKLLTQEEIKAIVEKEGQFLRYKITEDGISPRSIPGQEGGIYTANSNEHQEDGYTTEDPKMRTAMMDKRLRKIYSTARQSGDLPEDLIHGYEDAEIGIIGYGYTYGPIMEAIENLSAEGIKVKFLQMRTLWPVDTNRLSHFIDSSQKVIVVDHNAQAQLSHLIRMVYENHDKLEVLRKYDGYGFTPEIIEKKVKEVLSYVG